MQITCIVLISGSKILWLTVSAVVVTRFVVIFKARSTVITVTVLTKVFSR